MRDLSVIRRRLSSIAAQKLSQVPSQERPNHIRQANRMLSEAWMLDKTLDPKASPEAFGQAVFEDNGMWQPEHLRSLHMSGLVQAETVEDMIGLALPSDHHLD